MVLPYNNMNPPHIYTWNTSLLIKLGTIAINTFLPMRNKFAYFCIIKIHASRFVSSQKAFSASWLWSIFPAKSCWNARSGSWLARGQVNIMDEAKLDSLNHSFFEVLFVWRVLRRCLGEELCPFCWPVPTAVIAVFTASRQLAERTPRCNGFTWIQKAVVEQTGRRPPNSGHNLFLMQIWLWEVLWICFSVHP